MMPARSLGPMPWSAFGTTLAGVRVPDTDPEVPAGQAGVAGAGGTHRSIPEVRAQEEDDRAGDVPLAEMDMSLPDVTALEILPRHRVVDELVDIVNVHEELPPGGRDDDRNLLESLEGNLPFLRLSRGAHETEEQTGAEENCRSRMNCSHVFLQQVRASARL